MQRMRHEPCYGQRFQSGSVAFPAIFRQATRHPEKRGGKSESEDSSRPTRSRQNSLELANRAVSTAGDHYQFVEFGGKHLLASRRSENRIWHHAASERDGDCADRSPFRWTRLHRSDSRTGTRASAAGSGAGRRAPLCRTDASGPQDVRAGAIRAVSRSGGQNRKRPELNSELVAGGSETHSTGTVTGQRSN